MEVHLMNQNINKNENKSCPKLNTYILVVL